MRFTDYLACLCARHYRGLIILLGYVCVIIGMVELCRPSNPVEKIEVAIPEDRVEIETWAGEINIDGLSKIVKPAVDAIRTSNHIEAEQNHKQWKDLPRDPDEYK